jgi:hypothetical protein
METADSKSTWWSTFLAAALGSGAVAAALVALIPIYFPAPRSFEWVKSGLPANDCNYNDTAATYSKPIPQGNCSAADVDTIALCWDGTQYKNASNPQKNASLPWCTYKAIKADQCKGSGTHGIIWTCRAVQKAG